ncbi:MAG: hypothetical protein VX681_16785 [Myxococcota bacterium]|nr:hypothetical protein [Myxococcota bacterium]
MIRLSIDFECSAEEWWENGGRDLWESLAEGFDNNDVLLDEPIAQSVMAQAAQLPGWESGHDHAPHPLRLEDVDEDEEL